MRRQLLYVLCAMMIVITQFVAVAHREQHLLDSAHAEHCEICALADATPMPVAEFVLPPVTGFVVEELQLPAVPIHDRRPFARPNGRAPPAILA